MDVSLTTNDSNTPSKIRGDDEHSSLAYELPGEGDSTGNETQSCHVKDLEDFPAENDVDNLNQNEGEHIRLPLLALSDRQQEPTPKRNLQLSPFRKSIGFNTDETPGSVSKQDVIVFSPKRANQVSQNVDNRHRQRKDDPQTVPLLGVSAAPYVGFYPENIELEVIKRDESNLIPETSKGDKGVNVNDNNGQSNKETLLISRYNAQRRKGAREVASSRGKSSKVHDLLRHKKWKFVNTVPPEPKKELTRSELIKSYRLHIFVCVIFVITLLSVSLSWYFKNEAKEKLYSSQAIFFNPRTRELTLSDSIKSATVRGLLGQDIPKWMLPLHCPIVMGDDPHRKECLWKKIAVLRVTHFQNYQVNCYNISWESLGAKYVPHDCLYIDDAKWYGPSNQSESSFPIQGEFQYRPLNYKLNNNGLFDRVVDFYWLSSSGAAIYIDANNPIQLTWNISGNNQLCFQSNFSGSLYHNTNFLRNPIMNYTLCQGTDTLKTHQFMQAMFASQDSVQYPPDSMLQSPHWSLMSSTETEDLDQNSTINLAQTISNHNFHNNIITLDGNWQRSHGDLEFDEDRFSNVTEMMDKLQASGCSLTLCVSPYFHYLSENFHTGVTSNMFVKDAGGKVTGLTKFQEGLAAILDVFAKNGREWYSQKLQNITKAYQIKSYRLTYGHESWLPYQAHFEQRDATPNMYRKHVTELFGALPDSSLVVEYTSDSRHVTSLLSVPTGLSNDKKCLTGIIETALTLGLMGYPFVMADGINVGQKMSEDVREPSRELYIRWLQLAHLFPAYQYNIPPWTYDDVVDIARNLSLQRMDRVIKEMKNKDLQLEVAKGFPILRPVWWLNSHNRSVHDMKIRDEFLIGNNLLVAPILCEGIKEREVYIPPGIWEYKDRETIVLGPNVITIYNVTLDSVIIFQRRPIAGETISKFEL